MCVKCVCVWREREEKRLLRSLGSKQATPAVVSPFPPKHLSLHCLPLLKEVAGKVRKPKKVVSLSWRDLSPSAFSNLCSILSVSPFSNLCSLFLSSLPRPRVQHILNMLPSPCPYFLPCPFGSVPLPSALLLPHCLCPFPLPACLPALPV